MLIDHVVPKGAMGAQPVTVAELFAGVGGFRGGLEGWPDSDEETEFKVVWSNQWEPGEAKQWASKIYESRFGSEGHSNDDIHDIAFNEGEMAETIRERVPEHDLLVGGFPCQDYSVARTISGELGIKGEKGKLWIPIRNIIRHKRPRPKVVLLENVPRLLNSPANARGLNFAIILNDLLRMSYHVEWRVINAAEYGMPQKRKRVFILAYRNSNYGTPDINGKPNFGCKKAGIRSTIQRWIIDGDQESSSPLSISFPCKGELPKAARFLPELDQFGNAGSPFGNAGYAWKKKKHTMPDGTIIGDVNMFWTANVEAVYDDERKTLGDVLVDKHDLDYEITDEDKLRMYAYIKGEQKEWRIRKEDADKAREIEGDLWDLYQRCTRGYKTKLWAESRGDPRYLEGLEQGLIYDYTAGAMAYPDPLDKASRTVVTAEIGKSVSRMRHVIENPPGSGNHRGLMPLELERLNMFPDNWTEYEGISDSRRGFLMGNALVVGIIERLAGPLARLIRRREE